MYLLKGAALGFVLESFAQGLILLLVQPFNAALNIVSQIAIPMIVANTIGLFLWMYFFNKWKMTQQTALI
jgi:LytS/YehU family sensor histidine kinase